MSFIRLVISEILAQETKRSVTSIAFIINVKIKTGPPHLIYLFFFFTCDDRLEWNSINCISVLPSIKLST